MPAWTIMSAKGNTGTAVNNGTSPFVAPMGGLRTLNTVENRSQFLARDTYTWSRLYVRVTANGLTAATTIVSRKNGANGNQSITIGSGATGVFSDEVNSDGLVSGDLFNSQIVAGATGVTITFTIVASRLFSSSAVPILGLADDSSVVTFGQTRYDILAGEPEDTATELDCQYTFRVAATLSNLRAFISANDLDAAVTIRTRINGINGAQSLSIGAAATGSFEDAVNTDAIVTGNLVNYQIVAAGTVGSITYRIIQLKSAATGRQAIASRAGLGSDAFGTTFYRTLEGSVAGSATESDCQAAARGAFVGKNLFARCTANTLDGATTVGSRKNGAAGNLSLSIGAGATGAFEDTVNADSFADLDLVDSIMTRGGTAGNSSIGIVGLEQQQPAVMAAPKFGSLLVRMRAIGGI